MSKDPIDFHDILIGDHVMRKTTTFATGTETVVSQTKRFMVVESITVNDDSLGSFFDVRNSVYDSLTGKNWHQYANGADTTEWFLVKRPKSKPKVGDTLTVKQMRKLPFASIVVLTHSFGECSTGEWGTVVQKNFGPDWAWIRSDTYPKNVEDESYTRTLVWLPSA